MAYTDYKNLREYINNITTTGDLSTFKTNNEVNAIFEHKNCKWGDIFYNLIKKEFNTSDEEILNFCKKNDSIGNPQLQTYSFGAVASNSIKYVYHANLVLRHAQSLGKNKMNFVEIGGGYGGMALAVIQFAPKYGIDVETYNFIDLPEIIKLQELYIKSHMKDMSKFNFYSAFEYGSSIEKDDLYVIAVYSLGELDNSHQTEYIKQLFPKVSHGFIIWNALPYMSLGKDELIVPERPMTGPHNRFIFF
jgi:hypothetical protein